MFFIAFIVNPDVLYYDEFTQHKEELFEGIEIEDWADREEGKFAANEEDTGSYCQMSNCLL